jgi:transposase-like protein
LDSFPALLGPDGDAKKHDISLTRTGYVLYLFSIRPEGESRMSACLEAAPPTAPCGPSAEARAARLAKFERERLIVEYLNRGVSVAEIAAHVGVSEKRMRAIIREILARRMPAPPEEFVAIQVSRLNEALLVAYSAMSGMNLKAVDRVVKIVRELDRYHGFVAAERRLPDASRLEAPAQSSLAFGAALFCRAEFAPQELEKIEFAPGLGAPSPALQEKAAGVSPPDDGKRALVPALSPERESEPAPQAESSLEPAPPALGAPNDRPENPVQDLEELESAPGMGLLSEASNARDAAPERCDGFASGCAAPPAQESLGRDASLRDRPQDTPKRIERIESGPGDSSAVGTLGPDAARERGAFTPCSRPGRGSTALPATPSNRPENPPQHLEKLQSAPGNGLHPEAPPALGGTPIVAPSPLNPIRFPKLRTTLNGVAAG